MNNKEIAQCMAHDIFVLGSDGPTLPAVRLQYRVGSLREEKAGGGFIEPALAHYLEKLLDKYLAVPQKGLDHE